MIPMTFISGIVIPAALVYVIIGGASAMVKELTGKQAPVTTIKFKDWSAGK